MVKKFIVYFFIIFSLGTFFSSCINDQIESVTKKDALTYKSNNFKYNDSTFQVKMDISSLEFTKKSNTENELNSKLNSILFGNNANNDFEENCKILRDSLLNYANSFEVEYKEPKVECIKAFEVMHENADFISLQYTTYDFSGGAHGMQMEMGYNYLFVNQQFINLNLLIQEDKFDELKTLIISKLKANNQINQNINLNEAGFFISDSEFEISNNFLITKSGIDFIYNPYEIAPYSNGIIKISVNFNDLNPTLTSLAKKLLSINAVEK